MEFNTQTRKVRPFHFGHITLHIIFIIVFFLVVENNVFKP